MPFPRSSTPVPASAAQTRTGLPAATESTMTTETIDVVGIHPPDQDWRKYQFTVDSGRLREHRHRQCSWRTSARIRGSGACSQRDNWSEASTTRRARSSRRRSKRVASSSNDKPAQRVCRGLPLHCSAALPVSVTSTETPCSAVPSTVTPRRALRAFAWAAGPGAESAAWAHTACSERIVVRIRSCWRRTRSSGSTSPSSANAWPSHSLDQ